MGTIKLCTNLEQSKKLIELGLDVNTADMFWDMAEPEERRTPTVGPISDYDDMEDWAVPSWSLGALLEILPMPTLEQDKADGELFWQCSVYNDEGEKLCEEYASDKVEACVNLITRLHELKRLDCLNCWRA